MQDFPKPTPPFRKGSFICFSLTPENKLRHPPYKRSDSTRRHALSKRQRDEEKDRRQETQATHIRQHKTIHRRQYNAAAATNVFDYESDIGKESNNNDGYLY